MIYPSIKAQGQKCSPLLFTSTKVKTWRELACFWTLDFLPAPLDVFACCWVVLDCFFFFSIWSLPASTFCKPFDHLSLFALNLLNCLSSASVFGIWDQFLRLPVSVWTSVTFSGSTMARRAERAGAFFLCYCPIYTSEIN